MKEMTYCLNLKREYTTPKAEFRTANSLPEYNYFDVRNGAFRTTNYLYRVA